MTGTIQDASKSIRRFIFKTGLQLTFTNGESSATLEEGAEIYLSGNKTVKKRLTADRTKFPIGYIVTGGAFGQPVVAFVNISSDLLAKAIGGAFTAGQFVVPNGNVDTDTKVPEYIAAATGDYAHAIVLSGAAQNGEAVLGLLFHPQLIP